MPDEINTFVHKNDVRGTVMYLSGVGASGYRPATSDDFSASANVSVGSVGVTGNTGAVLQVLDYQGYKAIPVILTSGTVNATNTVTTVGITGANGSSAIVDSAGSLRVGIASGLNPVTLNTGVVTTQTVASTISLVSGIAASNTNVLLSAVDSNRKCLMIFNNASTTMYVRFGTAASQTGFSFYLNTSGLYESTQSCSTDAIHGIWDGTPVGSGLITILR